MYRPFLALICPTIVFSDFPADCKYFTCANMCNILVDIFFVTFSADYE